MKLPRTRPVLAIGLLFAACLPARADRASRYVPSELTVTPLSSRREIPVTGIPMHRRVHRRMPQRSVNFYPLLVPSLALPKAMPPIPLPEAPQPNVAEQPTRLIFPGVFADSSALERL